MQMVRFFFRLTLPVGALLCGLHGAGAQGDADARQACTPDAMRLCSEFIPDVAKVTACMASKRSQLSPACRTAMGGGSRAHRTYRHRARVHCSKYSHHCH
jgi:hypothetical protein